MKILIVLAFTLASSVHAGQVDEQYAKERIAAHTSTVSASESEHALASVFRTLRKEDLQKLGLSGREVRVLSNVDVGNYRIVPIFRPFADQMREVLRSETIDALKLGSLLMEAKEAEQAYKSKIYRAQIRRLSRAGQERVNAKLAERSRLVSFVERDLVSLAADVPEVIISMARNFVRGMEAHRESNHARPTPEVELSVDGQWGVVWK